MHIMKRFAACALSLSLLALPGCAGKVTGATPIATAALRADAVVIRINELQAVVIQICGFESQCAPNTISTVLARDIVQTCIDVRTTLKAIPAGWQATVKTAWVTARRRFAAVTNPAILAALAGVDALIQGGL